MIEAGMYIALGFFAATLIALAVIPALYRRAVRLTQDAILAVNPSSYAEVRAVQDFERANHALAVRRVETALEREREAGSGSRAEAGRLQMELLQTQRALDAALKKLEKGKSALPGDTAHQTKLRGAALDQPSPETEAAAEMHALREQLIETEQALAATTAELDLLKARTDDTIASWRPGADTMALATITGLEAQIGTLKAKLARAHQSTGLKEAGTAPELLPDPDEMQEIRSWAAKLESDLVDAEARYISAQAEVTRLSLQLEQTDLSADDQRETLERDLKWADNETARLTALIRDRERALERTGSKLHKLREDLRRTPELADLRADLLDLSDAILNRGAEGEDAGPDDGKKKPRKIRVKHVTQKAEASANVPEETPVTTSASALLDRIVKASRTNVKAQTEGAVADASANSQDNAETAREPAAQPQIETKQEEASAAPVPATAPAPTPGADDADDTTAEEVSSSKDTGSKKTQSVA